MRVCAAVRERKGCFYEGVISEKANEEKCGVRYLDGTSSNVDRSDIRILFRPFPVELPEECTGDKRKEEKREKKKKT